MPVLERKMFQTWAISSSRVFRERDGGVFWPEFCFIWFQKSNFHLLIIMLAHEAFGKSDNPQNCHKDRILLFTSFTFFTTYVFTNVTDTFTFMSSGEERREATDVSCCPLTNNFFVNTTYND